MESGVPEPDGKRSKIQKLVALLVLSEVLATLPSFAQETGIALLGVALLPKLHLALTHGPKL